MVGVTESGKRSTEVVGVKIWEIGRGSSNGVRGFYESGRGKNL